MEWARVSVSERHHNISKRMHTDNSFNTIALRAHEGVHSQSDVARVVSPISMYPFGVSRGLGSFPTRAYTVSVVLPLNASSDFLLVFMPTHLLFWHFSLLFLLITARNAARITTSRQKLRRHRDIATG